VNKTQLRSLLVIDDPEKETMYGVIGRMKVLLTYFDRKQEYSSLLPFLKTYYYVTEAGAEKYLKYKHYFYNLQDFVKLDVYFATLYFKPLFLFLTEGELVKPWQTYFHYCRRGDGVPFLQMLLGINAHINADLYTALIDLEYKHQGDFFLVNDILQEVTPSVMRYLAFAKHDILGLTGLIWKDFALTEFHNIVERWRSEAWAHAQLTSKDNKQVMQTNVIEQTEEMGKLLLIHLTGIHRLHTIPEVVSTLHTLSLQIGRKKGEAYFQ